MNEKLKTRNAFILFCVFFTVQSRHLEIKYCPGVLLDFFSDFRTLESNRTMQVLDQQPLLLRAHNPPSNSRHPFPWNRRRPVGPLHNRLSHHPAEERGQSKAAGRADTQAVRWAGQLAAVMSQLKLEIRVSRTDGERNTGLGSGPWRIQVQTNTRVRVSEHPLRPV